MEMQTVYTQATDKMEKAIDVLERDYSAIRAGRANPKVLDRVQVDYYGTPTPINQMAAVSVTDPQTITIQPWDMSALKDIERAIQSADIGINPMNDGKVLRLSFPSITEERRKELAKEIAKRSEESKVAIRNVRRDAIDTLKKMKKDNEVTEDDLKEGEKKLQDITDKAIKKVEDVEKKKEKEILSI